MKLATASAVLSLLMSATAWADSPSPSPVVAAPVPVPTSSAGQSEPETLTAGGWSGGTRISGWFVAPTFAGTGFDDHVNYSPGLRGGIYLNKSFAVGLTAQGLVSSATTLENDELRNMGRYGGLLLQYVWRSDQLIHGTLESTIGTGRWCSAGDPNACVYKSFLVFEPVANIEVNVAKHVRFATGVGYRFAAGGSGDGPSTRDMSGLVVQTSVIFGSF
jgi:opacity protein-like surface antigen